VDNIDGCFEAAAEQLRNNGVEEQKVLFKNKWIYSKL
jgi:hypothetical protein